MKLITRRSSLALALCAFVGAGLAGCGGGGNALVGTPNPAGPQQPTNDARDVPVGAIVYAEAIDRIGPDDGLTSRSEIVLRRAGDAGRRILSGASGADNSAPAISPDGSRVAFLSEGDIYTVKADGSDLKSVTTNSGARFDKRLQWTSDGRGIAFLAREAGGSLRPGLFVARVSDGVVNNLIRRNENILDFSLSSDGRNIAYVLSDERGFKGQLVVAPLDGQGGRIVLEAGDDAQTVAFAPDGQRLAYSTVVTSSNGITQIGALAIVDLEGNGARPLPIGDDLVTSPTWSPDGAYLAYEGFKFRYRSPSYSGIIYNRVRIIAANGASEPRDLGVAGSTSDQTSPSWGR